LPCAYASIVEDVREAANRYSNGEAVMIDGPFYVADKPYYIADYMLYGETRGSLVYDPARGFITDEDIMRKVFATRDLKTLTLWDPLFYAIGDHTKIPLAAKYETQNVRNFAEFTILTEDEKEQLETFLEDYEKLAQDISECSKITNDILYPEDAYTFRYSRTPPNLIIEIKKSSATGRYSYEGFEKLVDVYKKIFSDYLQLGLDLNAFTGRLEEYPPGTTIREKWEIVVTKEDIIKEVELVGENADVLDKEIGLREDILSYDYASKIDEAKRRLAGPKQVSAKSVCGPNIILIMGVLGGLVFLSLRRFTIFILIAMLSLSAVPLSSALQETIPTPDELISQKIKSIEGIQIKVDAEGIDLNTSKEVLKGFPLLLEGEGVIVRGPYYYGRKPNYIFDITKDGVPTGYIFLVDGVNFRLVGSQRMAFQLQKTRFLSDMIKRKPLYSDVNAEIIKTAAEEAKTPPLDIFLENLTENVIRGKELEKLIVEKPDFETLKQLTENYIRGFILLDNLERLTSIEEAKRLTGGFSEKKPWLEAYARAARGMSADEYLEARRSQYRGRTINRIPLMYKLQSMGMSPSKAQLVHDLASDLLYDNIFLWHLKKELDPNLFARLAFKEGTFTLPGMLTEKLNQTK
jgi:hypothetical protein